MTTNTILTSVATGERSQRTRAEDTDFGSPPVAGEAMRKVRDRLRRASTMFAVATDLQYRSGPAAAEVLRQSDTPVPWFVACLPGSAPRHKRRRVVPTREDDRAGGVGLGSPPVVVVLSGTRDP